jgi:hypothetical protein
MAQLKDLIVNGASQLIGDVKINAKLIDGVGSAGSNGQVLLSTDNTIQWSNMPETYSLPFATDKDLGGIKIGYTSSEKNYAVQIDNDKKAYVNVPWSDTTYTFDGIYNASSNKAATVSTVNNAIANLGTLHTLTIGSSSCQVFAEADITIPIYNGTYS